MLFALVATLLESTVVVSASESLPITLVLFLCVSGALRFHARPHASAALGLTLLLVAPAILRMQPELGSFSGTSSVRCEGGNNSLGRLLEVLFFPVIDPWLTVSAFFLAALALWLVARPQWRALGPALRWAALVAAVVVELGLLRDRGRPGAEAYLDANPVIAALFPTTDVPLVVAGDRERHYPVMEIGPISVARRCDSVDCVVQFGLHGAEGEHEVEMGCVKASERVVLRHDAKLDLWFVDKAGDRYAFRVGDGNPSLAWTEITRRALLPFTGPPRGWLITPALAVVVALYASLRRRLAVRRVREIDSGVEGIARGGFIDLPGGGTVRAPNGLHLPDGPVVTFGAVMRPGSYRDDPAPRAARVLSGAKTALLEAARVRVLDWDLHAVAVVVLALLVISPWLRYWLAHL